MVYVLDARPGNQLAMDSPEFGMGSNSSSKARHCQKPEPHFGVVLLPIESQSGFSNPVCCSENR